MQTQTTERRELLQEIEALSNDSVIAILNLIKSLKPITETAQNTDDFSSRTPNAETRAAMAELRTGKGKKFSNIEALMADLHDGNDD